MRASVAAAWPDVVQRWEGLCFWMYLDTKGLVTTGVGNLIDPVSAALALEWVMPTGTVATPVEVDAEWHRVKDMQASRVYNGLSTVWSGSATMRLTRPTVDALVAAKTAEFWATLKVDVPLLETFPADAQLALMDMAWQNGGNFLDPSSVWVNTRAGVLAQDWAKCATQVPGTGARSDFRRRLFNNAAAVVRLKADPARLWDTVPPVAPPVPVPPAPPKEPTVSTTTIGGEKFTLLHSTKYGCDYVNWRGGNLAPRSVMKLKKIPEQVTIMQGGLSFGTLSAMTHAGIGTFDVRIKGLTMSQVWAYAEHCLQINILFCIRGYVRDSFQGPTVSNKIDGNEHGHLLDLDCLGSMHPDAQAQVHELLHGGDGLRGDLAYYGPSISKYLRKWADSPWNTGETVATLPSGSRYVDSNDNVVPTAHPPNRYRRGTFHTTQPVSVHRWADSQSLIKRTLPVNTNVQVGTWMGQNDGHGWVQNAQHSTEYFNFDQLAVGGAPRPA